VRKEKRQKPHVKKVGTGAAIKRILGNWNADKKRKKKNQDHKKTKNFLRREKKEK